MEVGGGGRRADGEAVENSIHDLLHLVKLQRRHFIGSAFHLVLQQLVLQNGNGLGGRSGGEVVWHRYGRLKLKVLVVLVDEFFHFWVQRRQSVGVAGSLWRFLGAQRAKRVISGEDEGGALRPVALGNIIFIQTFCHLPHAELPEVFAAL